MSPNSMHQDLSGKKTKYKAFRFFRRPLKYCFKKGSAMTIFSGASRSGRIHRGTHQPQMHDFKQSQSCTDPCTLTL